MRGLRENLGQTKRQFGTPLKEYQKAGKCALAEHVCDTKHGITWGDSKIIATNSRHGRRRCLKARGILMSHPGHNIAVCHISGIDTHQ